MKNLDLTGLRIKTDYEDNLYVELPESDGTFEIIYLTVEKVQVENN